MTAQEPWKLTGPKYSHNMRLWLNKYVKGAKRELPKALVEKSSGRVFLHFPSFVGGTDEMFGAWVGRIITQGSRTMTTYYPGMRLEDFRPDPTFWERYFHTGICALDPSHRHYSDRWICEDSPETQEPGATPAIRTCAHCGLVQRQYVWDEHIVERRREWV